jgi:hypothetical protein
MISIVLYSTGCPKCSILEKKREEKKIPYDTVTDIEEMITLGINEVPVLSVNGDLLPFAKAVKWINEW